VGELRAATATMQAEGAERDLGHHDTALQGERQARRAQQEGDAARVAALLAQYQAEVRVTVRARVRARAGPVPYRGWEPKAPRPDP
jgi:hypothetical protein